MLYIGRSTAKTGERRWHGALPLSLAAVGMGIGIFTRDPIMNLVFVCLTAVGIYGAFGVWWSYPTTFLSGAAAAGAVGFINSFGNMGGYLGPYLTGLVRHWTGSFHLAYLVLAFMLLLSAALMLTLKETGGRHPIPVRGLSKSKEGSS
jgi:predicted MFS family arabinose efflux permease